MNYGLWMSAAGLSTEVHRQDIIANNVANAETAGFKADSAFTIERKAPAQDLGLATPSAELLTRLGGGVLANDTMTDYGQGAMVDGGPLDVAIDGDGFFAVRDGDSTAYTRDGRFKRDRNGFLVDMDGRPVLDDRQRPIRLGEGQVQIATDGMVSVNTDGVLEEVGRLGVAAPPQDLLRKSGDNLFQVPEGTRVDAMKDPRVAQGSYETSNVDPIRSMSELIQSSRSVQAAARFIDFHDRMMELAVTRIAVG